MGLGSPQLPLVTNPSPNGRLVMVSQADVAPGGRVARPIALIKIAPPWFNTTPVRPLGVKILNLGCPVLDALQGRGFWFDFQCPNDDLQFPRKEESQKPHPSERRKDGPPKIQLQSPGHPPCAEAKSESNVKSPALEKRQGRGTPTSTSKAGPPARPYCEELYLAPKLSRPDSLSLSLPVKCMGLGS
jgi:hypothetical protein